MAANKVTPCLWFDDRIEAAANYYAELFKGKIMNTSRYPDGRVLTVHIEMLGTVFMLLNGGPTFKFSEAVSFIIDCADQAQVDFYWNRFIGDGGAESACGWCKDKFGLSWQVVPSAIKRTVGGPDKEGAARAAGALMKMRKLIVAELENAYAGK